MNLRQIDNPKGSEPPQQVEISVVIPLLNEEDNVIPLYERLQSVLDEHGEEWEVIFVDDGSTDLTYARITQLHREAGNVHIVRLRRHFGQTAALAAGFEAASGTVIVTMDGDLQNDPADIPVLLAKIDEGYDVATGWRRVRNDPLISRRLPSKIANWIISRVTGVPLRDAGCALKAMRRDIVAELNLYGEMHRYIGALAHGLGARVVEVPVRHHERTGGRSKYGFGRLPRVILDLLTVKFLSTYSRRPGHLFGLIGLVSLTIGSILTTTLGIQKIFFSVPLADRPLLHLGMLLVVSGIQLLTLGLIGEVICRTYHETQRNPVYHVREYLPPGVETIPDAGTRVGPKRKSGEKAGGQELGRDGDWATVARAGQ